VNGDSPYTRKQDGGEQIDGENEVAACDGEMHQRGETDKDGAENDQVPADDGICAIPQRRIRQRLSCPYP
jgi:hypothetical protein